MKFQAKKIGGLLATIAHSKNDTLKHEIKDIAKYIVSSGKSSKTNEVIRHFVRSYNKLTNNIDVTIKGASKDSFPVISKLGDKNVSAIHIVDRSLIGGNVIEGEDFLIDSSIKHKIDTLRNLKNVIQL